MPDLRILEINDPHEFVSKIQEDQNDYLYVYLEDVFKPSDDIYDKAIELYKAYLPAIMFTDLTTKCDGMVSHQYFQDIHGPMNSIICSPIFARFAPLNLQVYPDLKYHTFSFLNQAVKSILPWHIPQLGFTAELTKQEFELLSRDCSWVLQHATS